MEEEGGVWNPPSEAEAKVLAAKRERNDRISKLMGEYLLKGYKMLGSTCPDCGTILLEERSSKKKYCVACSEIDCEETAKDNPVLNPQAASHQIAESRYKTKAKPEMGRKVSVDEPLIVPKKAYLCYADPTEASSQVEEMEMSIHILFDQLNQATRDLQAFSSRDENPSTRRQYVGLIKDCAEAITSLKRAIVTLAH